MFTNSVPGAAQPSSTGFSLCAFRLCCVPFAFALCPLPMPPAPQPQPRAPKTRMPANKNVAGVSGIRPVSFKMSPGCFPMAPNASPWDPTVILQDKDYHKWYLYVK